MEWTGSNRFILLRHGESLANVSGIIVADPANGVSKYGLSAEGFRQAVAAAKSIAGDTVGDCCVVVSSDFKRANETAAAVAARLGVPVETDTRLRERSFGDFETQPVKHYADVWAADARNDKHWLESHAVEHVDSVFARVTACVKQYDEMHYATTLIIVAHGDVLQILQTAFSGLEPRRHREVPHMATAIPRFFPDPIADYSGPYESAAEEQRAFERDEITTSLPTDVAALEARFKSRCLEMRAASRAVGAAEKASESNVRLEARRAAAAAAIAKCFVEE